MHTIDMSMKLDCCDTRFAGAMALCQQEMPLGIAFWCQPRGYRPGEWVFSLKADAHKMSKQVNVSEQDLLQIKTAVEQFLNQDGLTIGDFNINRIDFDRNVRFKSADEMNRIITLLQKTPLRACYGRRLGSYETSLYHGSKSRVTQVYVKDAERKSKCQPIEDYEKLIFRQEVQVKREYIRQRERSHGIPRTWDAWVSIEHQNEYLAKTKDLIPVGDFYSLDQAKALVDASALKEREKEHLKQMLEEISETDMSTAKSKGSLNTYKKYLGKLEMLDINPITISEDMGVDHIPFPLFRA